MPRAILFDDGHGALGPLTDLRASFEVRTGALTSGERLARVLGAMGRWEVVGVVVPERLAALVAERSETPVNDGGAPGGGSVLLVNGRCVLLPEDVPGLAVGRALIGPDGESVIAAHLTGADAARFRGNGCVRSALGEAVAMESCADDCLLARPWDVIRFRDQALDIDLALLAERASQDLPPGVIGIEAGSIFISPEAAVYPGVVLDAGEGPIVIDDDALIRPGAVVCGPAYIGRGCTVVDRAFIKAHTAIGPVCKVAGEVGGTIFQGYANKSHDGHLGDSWVGEWVNFGAGTTNSNLLNTYGEIVSQVDEKRARERTGLQYFGCIVGDHVKLAIGTRIMTGSVFGTGAMLATTAPPPTAVERFGWLTDERRQRYRFNKFMDVARRVMARRGVEASGAYEGALRGMYEESPSAREGEVQ